MERLARGLISEIQGSEAAMHVHMYIRSSMYLYTPYSSYQTVDTMYSVLFFEWFVRLKMLAHYLMSLLKSNLKLVSGLTRALGAVTGS